MAEHQSPFAAEMLRFPDLPADTPVRQNNQQWALEILSQDSTNIKTLGIHISLGMPTEIKEKILEFISQNGNLQKIELDGILTETDLDFVSAIAQMANEKDNVADLRFALSMNEDVQDLAGKALAACSIFLTELYLSFGRGSVISDEMLEAIPATIGSLHCLKRLSLTNGSVFAFPTLVASFANLGNWEHLQELTLRDWGAGNLVSDYSTFQQFLEKATKLQALWIEFGANSPLTSEKTNHILLGLQNKNTIKCLGLVGEIEDVDAYQPLAKYLVSEKCTLKTLAMECFPESSEMLSDGLAQNTSLQLLKINIPGVLCPLSFAKGFCANKTLKSLEFLGDGSVFFDLLSFFKALKGSDSTCGLEEFKFDDCEPGEPNPSVDCFRHLPSKLTSLRFERMTEDILGVLLEGIQKTNTVRKIHLGTLETDNQINLLAQALPKITSLTHLSFNVNNPGWFHNPEENGEVVQSLKKGMKANQSLEHLAIDDCHGLYSESFHNALQQYCVRNTVANVSKSMDERRLPITSANRILRNLETSYLECNMPPGLQGGYTASVLYPLLKRIPGTDTMDHIFKNMSKQPHSA